MPAVNCRTVGGAADVCGWYDAVQFSLSLLRRVGVSFIIIIIIIEE